MRTEYRKLKSIIKNSLNVDSSKIHLEKNLSTDLGFCSWEVEYLLAKVENEFNISLVSIDDPNSITVHHLLQHIQNSELLAPYSLQS